MKDGSNPSLTNQVVQYDLKGKLLTTYTIPGHNDGLMARTDTNELWCMSNEDGNPLHLEPGVEHDFKIIKMNPDEKKVGLSIRAVGEEASRSEVEAYKQPVSSTSSTIGELISWKRASNEGN